MPTMEFLEEVLERVKADMPKWVYAYIVQTARAKAGGKVKAKNARERKAMEKAKWTAAFINDLPDSSFLYIEPGGEKDEDGKTVPRANRHFPYRNPDGSIDLPHLRNALARLDQSTAPGLDKDKIREKAENLLEREKENQVSKAWISFVVSEMSSIEKARNQLIVGETGRIFQELYLDPLGLDRDDVHVTLNKDEIEDINPHLVIALGKAAKEDLGELADFSLPHPEAIRRHRDSGEVGRKLKSIHKVLFDKHEQGIYFKDSTRLAKKEPIVEYKTDPRVLSKIIKAAPVKRIVYGVVWDPYGKNGAQEDAHNDWTSPAEIEKTAHDYLKSSRVVGLQHLAKANAQVVESSIEQYPSREDYLKALNGEPHRVSRRKFGSDVVHSGSWILGVELGEREWDLYKAGTINAFSPGGTGRKIPISKKDMPEVTFIDLVENNDVK